MTGFTWPRGLTPARLAWLTSVLLVVAIAWTLAQATWLFWPKGATVGEVAMDRPTPVTAAAPSYKLQSVADLSLYGSAQSVGGNAVDAPQTQLNLTLRGVWANSVAQRGRAIIGAGGGDEESYKVGDPLPGGATLEQVLPDRVILRRNGKLEALFLPKESVASLYDSPGALVPASLNDRSSRGAGRASDAPIGDVGTRLQEYRQRILNDPQEAFSLARMQPVMEDGKLKGYKLSPNKEKQLFREVGLRPGDVVTSVNGLALSDPAAAGQVLTQLSGASQLTLVVDRGGHQETIIVPVGQ